MSKIDKKSRIPIYYQLVDIISEEISRGVYKENDQLITEREYCEKYNVSRATVRQAIGILERDGIIYKIQGKGTFIAPTKIEQPLEQFYSFGDIISKSGLKPSSEILSFESIDATNNIKKIMKLEDNEQVYKLVRLRLANNEPILFETTFLPKNRFPNLRKEAIEEYGLYSTLKSDYNTILDYATETFSATSLDETVANYLSEEKGSSSIKFERLTFEKDKIIEFTTSISKGSKFKFTTILNVFDSQNNL